MSAAHLHQFTKLLKFNMITRTWKYKGTNEQLLTFLKSAKWSHLAKTAATSNCYICKSKSNLDLIYWNDVFTGRVYGVDLAVLCSYCANLDRTNSLRDYRRQYNAQRQEEQKKDIKLEFHHQQRESWERDRILNFKIKLATIPPVTSTNIPYDNSRIEMYKHNHKMTYKQQLAIVDLFSTQKVMDKYPLLLREFEYLFKKTFDEFNTSEAEFVKHCAKKRVKRLPDCYSCRNNIGNNKMELRSYTKEGQYKNVKIYVCDTCLDILSTKSDVYDIKNKYFSGLD